MTELFTVTFINQTLQNKHSCFLYFNEKDLQKTLKCDRVKASSELALKIQFGHEFTKQGFVSYNPHPTSLVMEDHVGISPIFAQRLGIEENSLMLVSPCVASSVQSAHVRPKSAEDYEILVSCKAGLEAQILNQIRIVSRNQIIPIQVFSNVIIDLVVEVLQPNLQYGILEQFTELIVLDTTQPMGNVLKPSIGPDLSPYEPEEQVDSSEGFLSLLFAKLRTGRTAEVQKHLPELDPLLAACTSNVQQSFELRVVPYPTLDEDAYSRFLVTQHNFGKAGVEPSGRKLVCKLNIIPENKTMLKNKEQEKHSSVNDDKGVYVEVLSKPEKQLKRPNYLYCSHHVMDMLKLYLGCRVLLSEVQPTPDMVIMNQKDRQSRSRYPESKPVYLYWDSMLTIKQRIVQVVEDNAGLTHKLNILLAGSPGCGKSHLLFSISQHLITEGVHCATLDCKPLRGKRVETLQKLLVEGLSECAYRQPSLLILDNLDALTWSSGDNNAEVLYNRLYVARIAAVLENVVSGFQRDSEVTLLATCQTTSHLGPELSSTRGPRLFECVLEVAEMTATERRLMLESLLSQHKMRLSDGIISSLVEKTAGYNIQDLVDLMGRVTLKCLVRKDSWNNVQNENQKEEPISEDFDVALVETVPLSLRGVELHKNIPHHWSDVGGLQEAKQVLTEVFMWPSRYSNVFETCPLRHQSGVLLFGAPGTGKTLLAGAVGNECGLNFISIKGPELLSKYVGASEEGVRNVFKRAQKAQPCVLFFDEFDSLAPRRGHDNTGVTDRVVNQLLTQMDGVETLTGVWVLAASSRPDLLDPALLRPGRLDRAVYCPLPNENERLSIMQALSKNLTLDADVSLSEVAAMTDGLTGADLQAVLYAAQMTSIKQVTEMNHGSNGVLVKQQHLLTAVAETKPSLSPFEKNKYQRIYERFVKSRGSDFSEDHTKPEQKKVTFA